MSSGKRFKFNGSVIQISTGVGSAKTITDIDQADPALVTSTAHGQVLGAVGRIAAVVGMTEVNGKLFVVDNPDTNDFELAGIDSTGYAAYTSGGTFTPLTFTKNCELTGIDQQDGTTDQLDATTVCSTAKEFEAGLSDSGSLTLNYHFAPNEPIQAAMRAAKRSGADVAIRVTMPNSGGVIIMIGSVEQSSFSGSNGNIWTGTTQFKLSGDIYVLEAA